MEGWNLILEYICGAQTRHDNVLRNKSVQDPNMSRDVADPKALVAMVDCPRLKCAICAISVTGPSWSFSSRQVGSRCLLMFNLNLNSKNPAKMIKSPPTYPKSSKIIQTSKIIEERSNHPPTILHFSIDLKRMSFSSSIRDRSLAGYAIWSAIWGIGSACESLGHQPQSPVNTKQWVDVNGFIWIHMVLGCEWLIIWGWCGWCWW